MDAPIVEIEDGKLRGTIGTDQLGVTFFKFQGIPYSKTPERFQVSYFISFFN